MRRLIALTVLLAAFVPQGARAEGAITTFNYASEGCAGGGNVCGSFPLVPGDATYSHGARADGTVAVAAQAEGVLPACAVVRCSPDRFRFHAEAIAAAWTDVPVVPGTTSVVIAATYSVEQVHAAAEPLLGDARAEASVVISVAAAPGEQATCSNGSAPGGAMSRPVMASGEATTTLACPVGATLNASVWRVALTARASATADSGEAEAAAQAQLLAVSVEQTA